MWRPGMGVPDRLPWTTWAAPFGAVALFCLILATLVWVPVVGVILLIAWFGVLTAAGVAALVGVARLGKPPRS
jgi:hypothetical protein